MTTESPAGARPGADAEGPVGGGPAADDLPGAGASPGDAEQPPSVGRLLALTDGVVAIALTLLVLGLKIPGSLKDPHSWRQLAQYLNSHNSVFVSYVTSFYVIGLFWLVHHRVFRSIRGHSEGLAWWNFAFLLFITLMPFTSDLLGNYGENPLAIDIFAVNLLLASLATQLVLVFARRQDLLIDQTVDVVRAGRMRVIGTVSVLALSMVLAWFTTSGAKYAWFLLVFMPTLLERWSARRQGAHREGAPGEGTPAG